MHASCLDSLRIFVETYLGPYKSTTITILDVGSAVVDPTQASDRDAIPPGPWKYIGLDIEPGHNVDVVVKDPYQWAEVADSSVDVVICNQVLEHAEFFWLTGQEIMRVLKPRGLVFLCAPSAGIVHRYPTDCWRFFPDGLPALAKYIGLTKLESHVKRLPVYPKHNRWLDASLIGQKPDGDSPSVIAMTVGKNALEARELELLNAQPAWRIKWRAAKLCIRALGRIISYPKSQLGDIF